MMGKLDDEKGRQEFDPGCWLTHSGARFTLHDGLRASANYSASNPIQSAGEGTVSQGQAGNGGRGTRATTCLHACVSELENPPKPRLWE